MGKNTIKELLPEICKQAGVTTRYTGHCLRATFITRAYNAGISDYDITAKTKHKRPESLTSYKDPDADSAHATARKFHKSMVGKHSVCMPVAPVGPVLTTSHASTIPAAAPIVVVAPMQPLPLAPYQPPAAQHTQVLQVYNDHHAPAAPATANMADALALYNQGFASVVDRFRPA